MQVLGQKVQCYIHVMDVTLFCTFWHFYNTILNYLVLHLPACDITFVLRCENCIFYQSKYCRSDQMYCTHILCNIENITVLCSAPIHHLFLCYCHVNFCTKLTKFFQYGATHNLTSVIYRN